ncbi:phage major capsid protein, P2 family [Comamonas sp. B-9]|uniref:phage major capsid protein, P2 family n=1 Tax=Comamonas sp. B-9 TaxID=1055192 RepID=UPI000395C1AC|nr:phage major capsid protein, P2 family [Comamonas sp. B-9]
MKNPTREKFNGYLAQQASLSGVTDATKKFNIAPSVQQTLENRVQESSAFLKKINIVPVDEMSGDRLGLGIAGPIASRTDTSGNGERKAKEVHDLKDKTYECKQTNYDTALRYNTLDMWAKFKNFQTKLSDAIVNQCALDRIMIGFNGTHAAPTTDLDANPKLQDVNKGWLQDLRENAPERVMARGKAVGKVVVGGPVADRDYKTLDGLVYDARHKLIDEKFTESGDLVAIVGRDLMHDKLFPIVDGQDAPTEMLAASIVVSQQRLGGLQAVSVPGFPPKAVMVVSFDNISIYYQEGKRRRAVIDNPKKDQIETYESSNDAFVIENLEKACLVENIEIVED